MHLSIYFRPQLTAHDFFHCLAGARILVQNSIDAINDGCLHASKLLVTALIQPGQLHYWGGKTHFLFSIAHPLSLLHILPLSIPITSMAHAVQNLYCIRSLIHKVI